MASEGNEQAGQRNDKLKGLNLRLAAAAADGSDQREDQIRSHPDVQVCPQQQFFVTMIPPPACLASRVQGILGIPTYLPNKSEKAMFCMYFNSVFWVT